MEYEIEFLKNPTIKNLTDILDLYIEEGWWEDEPLTDKVLEIVKGSHIFAVCFADERIIAMARAISDKASDAYIQDFTVKKEFRNKKIGSALLKKLLNQLKKDKIFWIGLISEKNSKIFYEKNGFYEMKNAFPMKYKI
ncbi:MAG: GNAT family N-acetyltransferase [Desulfobacteraceae bacterium]|nr:GNAT family N-acetyltransferase [Desulfobacteraceae bacterium]